MISIEDVTWSEFEKMHTDWTRLQNILGVDALFLDWQWITGWWKHFSNANDLSFRGFVIRDDSNNVVGLVPFCVWQAPLRGLITIRRLQLLGNLHAGPITMRTEYNDLLIQSDYAAQGCVALVEHILKNRFWDDLVIQDANAESPRIAMFADLLSTRTYFRDIGHELDDQACRINVSGDFSSFVNNLSPNVRRRLFNRREYLQSLGDIKLEYATDDNIEGFFVDLNTLHEIRWGQPVFSDHRLNFHLDLSKHYLLNNALSLSRMSLNGKPVSVLYNLISGGREYNIQQGFDDKLFGNKLSPGLLHLGYAIERACSDPSIREFDLLAGRGKQVQYKKELTQDFTPLRSLQFVRNPILKSANRLRDRWQQSSTRFSPVHATVIVTAAHTITGYNTACSLRGHAETIIGIGRSDSTPFRRSNIWNSWYGVDYGSKSLLKLLQNIAKKEPGRNLVLFPCDDLAVETISDHREELAANYHFQLPSTEALSRLLNKEKFFEWATKMHLPIPKTLRIRTPQDLQRAISTFSRPFVIKPGVRKKAWDDFFPGQKLLLVKENDALEITGPKLFELSSEFLIQQWISGEDSDIYFCLCYFDKYGRLRGRLGGRKLMQWPPSSGSTAFCITHSDPMMLELGTSALSAAGLIGLGSMEFKKDPKSGKYFMIEPTVARNDHQSFISTKAGVNLSRLALYDALDLPCGWTHPARQSIWIDEISTVRHISQSSMRSNFSALIKCPLRIPAFATLNSADVKPGAALTLSGLRHMARRKKR